MRFGCVKSSFITSGNDCFWIFKENPASLSVSSDGVLRSLEASGGSTPGAFRLGCGNSMIVTFLVARRTVDPEASLVDGEGSADDGDSGIVLSSDLAGGAVTPTALL